MKPQQIEQTVTAFAIRLKMDLKHPEPNVYELDGYTLYLPGYNSVFDEELTSFQVDKGVTIPGQRTLNNGDPGYPDDYDVVEIGEFPTLLTALAKLGACIVEDWIDESGQWIDYMETEDADV